MKKNKLTIFILIILIASFIRIFELDKVPYGLFTDEVSEGYDAYSILKTGNDRYGNYFPLIFRSMDDYILPFYNYSIIPFLLLFDLNAWAVRLPAAIFGILSVIIVFFLVKRIFNENTALLASFFLAVSPWHSHYSRIAFPAIGFSFLFILGFFLMCKGLEKKKYFILSSIPFALSFYTYHTSKLFIPLFIIGFLFFYRKKINYKIFFFFLLILLLLSIPAIYTTFFGEGLKKFNEASIFKKNEEEEGLGSLFYKEENPYLYFIKNYLGILSTDFLFFKGDPNLRHNIKGFGQLYWFEIPLILFGLFLFFKRRTRAHKFLIYWLLIFPIVASLTNNGVHATRTLQALPLFQIISAYALFNIFIFIRRIKNKIKKIISYIILVLFIIFIIFNILFYFKSYFIDYPKYSEDLFEGGLKEGFDYMKSVEKDYDKIYITYSIPHPEIYLLFFTKYDPEEYQKNEFNNSKYQICAPQLCYKPGNIYLVKPYDMKKFKDFKIKKVIYYPNNKEAFWIVE